MGKADSGTFLLCNRNKRSMTLNLKHEEGKRIFRELAAQSDVLVEGFRPGVMDRLGLGYEALQGDQPAPDLLRDLRLTARTVPTGRWPGTTSTTWA